MDSASSRPVLIIGLGLIGGSLALALNRRGWKVAFADPAVSATDAADAGVHATRLGDLADREAGSLIVIATPVDVAFDLLATDGLADGPITSVCSVMSPLARAARSRGLRFTAGHPMAGKEVSGLAAAEAELFAGRRWFLDRDTADPAVRAMAEATGAEVIEVDAEEHDQAVALTSHLPQLLSTAMGALIGRNLDDLEPFVGSGLRGFLRLAGSPPQVWAPVFDLNGPALRRQREELQRILDRLMGGDAELEFEQAQKAWKALRDGGPRVEKE